VLPRSLIVFLFVFISSSANAQRLDITLKDNSARLSYVSLIGGSTFGRTEMKASYLYNENNNTVVDMGLQVIDVAGSKTPGLEIGVGPRFYYLKHQASQSTGAAIAIGGHLRYKLPQAPRFAVMANAFYAPSITSTLDAERMSETGLGIGYALLPTANIYLTYRHIRANFTQNTGATTLDNGISLGMSFSF
jgi:YfaZ precursor